MAKTIELNIPATAAERLAAVRTLSGRLRAAVAEMPHGIWPQWHPLMTEAANEIDRLQQEIDAILARQNLSNRAEA